jgi:GTP-binding protein
MTFTVAIVGRPNVGKSTLFNRLVGRRLALVDHEPGVTRDRREGEARLFDLSFRVIDTAGLEEAFNESLEARMRAQTGQAVATADLALFLIDAGAGVTPLDEHFAGWLRRGRTPVLLAANKCEGRLAESGLAEAHGLGLGEPLALSAEHGLGLGELYDTLRGLLEAHEAEVAARQGETAEAEDGTLQLAIIGRPNVGKSTLVNRLIGEERLLTGAEAGITRDAIAVDWRYKDRAIRLVDTAGLRRRPRVVGKIEKLSVADTLRAVRFAQVVVLLVDAEAPMEKQDLGIARMVVDEGRALVIAVNKWDACQDRQGAWNARCRRPGACRWSRSRRCRAATWTACSTPSWRPTTSGTGGSRRPSSTAGWRP